MDEPNERSSHEISTPRGGGLSIVTVLLGGVLIGHLVNWVPWNFFVAFTVGAGVISVIGFADDRGHVSPVTRVVAHFVAIVVAMIMLGGVPPVQFGMSVVDLGLMGDLFATIFLVWLINLFNFMDGIDGIAASEVICITGGALLIAGDSDVGFVGTFLVIFLAASMGFLAWNWPPAKVFMGDAGSGFVGFALGVVAIESVRSDLLPLWSWLILASLFIVDSTVTLIVRVGKREIWYSAHRSHAYQNVARHIGGHRPVTIAAIVINVFWLLPIAYAATRWQEYGLSLTCLAWLPLVIVTIWLRAGYERP